jgi:hypothetical protein
MTHCKANSWAHQIADTGQRIGITLYSPGLCAINTTEQLLNTCNLDKAAVQYAATCFLYTIGDLHLFRTGTIPLNKIDLQHLQIPQLPNHQKFNTLRRGQIWLSPQEQYRGIIYSNCLVQIISTTNDYFYTAIWTSTRPSNRLRVGQAYRCITNPHISTLHRIPTDAFSVRFTTTQTRVLLQPSTHVPGQYTIFFSEKVDPHHITMPHQIQLPNPPWVQQFQEQIALLDGPVSCFTDGSLTPDSSLLHDLLQHKPPTITGSLILLPQSWPTSPALAIQIFNDTPTINTVYLIELLSLTLALGLTNHQIYSDCESAVRDARRKHTHHLDNSHAALLHICQQYPTDRVSWTPSHPERRRVRHAWSYKDWGNFHADSLTQRNYTPQHGITFLQPPTIITTSDALRWLSCSMPQWHWREQNQLLCLSHLPTRLQVQRHQQYLDNRDLTSQCLPWASRYYQFAHRQFQTKSYGAAAAAARTIYDKHYHGRNRGKNKDNKTSCLLCNAAIEDRAHCLLFCPHPARTSIRNSLPDKLKTRLKTVKCSRRASDLGQAFMTYLMENDSMVDAWCGSWSQAMLNNAETFLASRTNQNSSAEDRRHITKALLAVLRVLASVSPNLLALSTAPAKSQDHTDSGRRGDFQSRLRELAARTPPDDQPRPQIQTEVQTSSLVRGRLQLT